MTQPARPTAFFLHALGASRREFGPLIDRLSGVFDGVALDLPGFGDQPAGAVTVAQMADHVIAAIRANGASRWILVGHSMGGKIASVVAARALSGEAPVFGLAGVVLLAGSPPSPEPMDEQRRAEMSSWAAAGPLDATAARAFVDANVGAPLDPDADALMLADLRRASPEAWLAWLGAGSREDFSAAVGVLDLPALILAGGADGDLGPAAQRELNGTVYPRARFGTLDGAGHLLPLERPDDVATAIAAFWRDSAGPGPAVPNDVARVIASDRTSARTRGALARRALADDPSAAPRALSHAQLRTLRAVADRVVPQEPPAIDLALRVDAQLSAGAGDGWRHAALPTDPEAYRLALDALAGFDELSASQQDARLAAIADGRHRSAAITPEQFTAWFADARVDLVRQWLAHPAIMSRIGYDGFANGGDGARLQGFERLGADEREAWEPLPLRVIR